MSTADQVLWLLRREPAAVSGEEIAAQLGVSRNAVWKAVVALRARGYVIDAVTRKGYTLRSERNALNERQVRRWLDPSLQGLDIRVRESVSSTNTLLKKEAEQGAPEGQVLLAERQTEGRGKMGRSFYSPKGSGLYLSVLLRPTLPAEQSLSITTAAAAAAARAIEDISGRKTGIKWVNDVYVEGRKVCGILTEASMDLEGGGLSWAVLGIGVNLREPEGGFGPQLAEIAGAVFDRAPPPGARARLAAGLLNCFFGYYRELEKQTYLKDYRDRFLLRGMDVTVVRGEESFRGKALGTDDQARLILRLRDGTRAAFSAGEVSVEKDFLRQLRERKEST